MLPYPPAERSKPVAWTSSAAERSDQSPVAWTSSAAERSDQSPVKGVRKRALKRIARSRQGAARII